MSPAPELDFARVETAPPPFPVDVLPATAQRFARDAARALPAPVDFLGVAILVTAGAAIGNTRVARLKASHTEHAAIFGVIVAGPGHKKSPALQLVTRPAWEHEHEAHVAWRREKEAAESAGRTPPAREHFVLSDVTMEAVAEVLDSNPRGFLSVRDELAAWVRSMDQYRPGGKGSDLQAWLSIYSGSSLTVKRMRRDSLHVPRPFVSILGGIQPAVLDELGTGPSGTVRADGFIDRLVFTYPHARPFESSREELAPDVEGGWARLIRTLYALAAVDGDPVPIDLAPDAREAFYAWHEALLTDARDGDVPEHLHGVYGKAEGLCLRLALILEMLHYADSRSTGELLTLRSVNDAARLVDYFLGHARRVYDHLNGNADERAAEALVAWMHRRGRDTVTARDVIRANVAKAKTAEHAAALFDIAERYGFGSRIEVRHPSGHEVQGFSVPAHA